MGEIQIDISAEEEDDEGDNMSNKKNNNNHFAENNTEEQSKRDSDSDQEGGSELSIRTISEEEKADIELEELLFDLGLLDDGMYQRKYHPSILPSFRYRYVKSLSFIAYYLSNCFVFVPAAAYQKSTTIIDDTNIWLEPEGNLVLDQNKDQEVAQVDLWMYPSHSKTVESDEENVKAGTLNKLLEKLTSATKHGTVVFLCHSLHSIHYSLN